MRKFDFNDMTPDLTEPDFSESMFSAPSTEDWENEFSNESVIPTFDNIATAATVPSDEDQKSPKDLPNKPEPNPASVNLSGMDGSEEKSSPQIDYGEENPVDADDVFNRKYPSIPPEKPGIEQEKAEKLQKNTKEMIIQGTAFLILLAIGSIAAMFFSDYDKKTAADRPAVTAIDSQESQAADELSVIETNNWEPGIISRNNVAPEHKAASAEDPDTEQPTTKETQPVTTEADKGTPAIPSDTRFKDVAELTLYIQNSTSVVYRKEKELVRFYIDGQTNLDTFLSTMNTYSTALNELSHLLVVNRNCYANAESTYQLLEINISTGMIYADHAIELANTEAPVSKFKEELEE